MATRKAADVIGYNFPELKSRSIYDLISPDVAGDFRDTLPRMMERELQFEGLETKMVGKDGNTIDVSISGVILRTHGKPCYHLTIRDNKEKIRARRELKKTREEADLYLDLISHDIANLNQIGMGYLEIALETLQLDDAGQELLKKPLEVFKSTSRLIRNVNMLRMVHHGEGVSLERVNLAGIIASLDAEFPLAAGRDIKINYHVAENCEVMANSLVREVFVNLIGNAIKHSHAGKSLNIDVKVDRTCIDGDTFCMVAVEDDGPGMPDLLKQSIMRHMTRHGGVRGKGVGLVLISTLVDDYGGCIRIEDRVPGDYGKGTRVVMLLPMAPESGHQVPPPG